MNGLYIIPRTPPTFSGQELDPFDFFPEKEIKMELERMHVPDPAQNQNEANTYNFPRAQRGSSKSNSQTKKRALFVVAIVGIAICVSIFVGLRFKGSPRSITPTSTDRRSHDAQMKHKTDGVGPPPRGIEEKPDEEPGDTDTDDYSEFILKDIIHEGDGFIEEVTVEDEYDNEDEDEDECLYKENRPAKSNIKETVNRQKCLRPECKEVSNLIRSKMDVKVDPCKDFYHFACGGWIKTEEKALATTEKTSWDNFDELKSKLAKRFEGKSLNIIYFRDGL
jgi:hypothetical protein